MKKTAVIAGAVLILLVVTILVVPVIFKKPLLEKTKTTINNQINARVDFEDFNLSIIRHFPKVTLELKNVTVLGTDNFAGDTLLSIPSFRTRISLASLFGKSGIALEELTLVNPLVNLKVDVAGNANWDIIKETKPSATPQPESSETFEMQLEKISVSGASIIYNDLSMPMFLSLKESQIDLKGNMYGSETELSGNATVGNFLLNYDSVTYISNSVVKTNSVFAIDFNQLKFTVKESEWWLNQLPFELTGDFSMPNDSMFFNLEFKAKRTGLGDFLALTPPDYEKYMKDVETEGTADFSGYYKGFMIGEEYPSFSFDFNIKNGRINYKSLPEQIRNISADVRLWMPQGDLDNMAFTVQNTHAEIAGNQVELSASVDHFFTDMNFGFGVKGKFDFTKLKNTIPVENMSLEGIVDADVFASGKYSDVELKKYENIQSDGKITVSNVVYSGSGLTQPIKVPSGALAFSPASIDLTGFKILAGNSDLSVSGKITNYFSYFLKNGVLGGDVQVRSENADITELMAMMPTTTDSVQSKTTDAATEVFSIPANYNFKISALVSKSKYENLPLSNIRLEALVKDGNLSVTDFSGNAGGSDLKLSAFYGKKNAKTAAFSVNGSLRGFDIPTIYNSLPTLKEMIPLAANATGKAEAQIKAEGEFSSEVKINILEGSATLTNFVYTEAELSQPVKILSGKLDFNLKEINLSQLNINIGASDMALTGKLSNFMEYYDSTGVLEGNLLLKSNFMNVNELMNLQTSTQPKTETPLTAFTIPANLKITFNTNISKALYDKLNISNINGLATVSNGKLDLQGLTMNMLDGELKLNGSYANNEQNKPDVDFGFAIQSFDIPSSFNMISFFQDKLPISKDAQGKFSTSFNMKGKLTSDLSFDFPSINGNGLFNTLNFQLIESKVFEQLAGVIKKEKLKNVKLDDFTTQFTIENGSIALKPFQTKIAGQDVKFSGNINAQNLLNLKMDFTIQRELFGPEIQKLLAVLPGQERIQFVPASITINGPVKDPAVGINLDDAKKLIQEEVKKSATDQIKNSLDKIGDILKK